jgi:uncharacterized protein
MAARPQSPVPPGQRIVALDVIRGLAMAGVLVAYCVWSLGTLPPESFSALDTSLETALAFLVDGKFYTLLAFLFGLGFQLQLDRAHDDDGEAVRVFRRRLLILAAIGLAHALLLRNGDILLPYAVVGLFLVPFRRASDRVLLGIAVLALLAPLFIEAVWKASGVPMPSRPAAGEDSYLAENFAWVRYWYATAILNWPPILTLFLAGLWAGRRRLVQRISEDRPLALRLLAAGLVAGILCYAAFQRVPPLLPAPFRRAAAMLLITGHAWGMATAYAAALILVLRTPAASRSLAPLAAIGRMALTNYLLQAALIVPLCLAFGLFDRFTPSTALLLAFAVFTLQAGFSVAWLRRFDFGPAEWVWRCVTYGRVPITRPVPEASL